MQIDFTQIIIALVGLVFSAVVIPLTSAAFKWLRGKTQNEALKGALDEAETVADNVVASLQANVVEGLKTKAAENGGTGKLSAEDIKNVSGQAVEMFLSDLSAKSLDILQDNADDITAYIKNLIEARLAASKKS